MKQLYLMARGSFKTGLAPFYLLALLMVLPLADTSAQNWQLVWQDEFNGSISPDWVFETGTGSGGWGNNELQYYRRENATIENNALVITARRENYGGRQYTSSRMKTQGRKSWKYGRIEARIAMPSFTGVWPAFWMLGDNITSVGWPACGEIDIMEHVNTEQATHGTIHWQDNNGNYANYGGYTGTNVTAYHTYAIEWNSSSIKWFLDGVQYHEVNIQNGVNGTSEFHNNFFIILNMAIGGNWPGFNVDNGAFPAKMYVDYVRVYKDGGSTGGGGGGFAQRIEAENFALQSGQMQTENCSEGGQNVGWLANGGWLVYDVNLPYSGAYEVQYRVASPNGGGGIQLEKAGGSPVYGQVSVPNTGGWQNWTTVSHTVNLSAGQQQLAIYIPSAGYNINWLRFSSPGSRLAMPDAQQDALHKLQAYPNPAQNSLTVSGVEAGASFIIYDMMGRKSREGTLQSGTLDVSGLTPGTYLLQLPEAGESLRFIKE
ncbi:MAG: carbohydrate-binding protein [Cyclobacteriaceae bacterium]